jgi:hypothetical protein
MEPKGSLPYSQEPIIEPSPEPDESRYFTHSMEMVIGRSSVGAAVNMPFGC